MALRLPHLTAEGGARRTIFKAVVTFCRSCERETPSAANIPLVTSIRKPACSAGDFPLAYFYVIDKDLTSQAKTLPRRIVIYAVKSAGSCQTKGRKGRI